MLPCLNLTLPRKSLAAFFPMLQKGCRVQCPIPLNVEDFLLALPGFSGNTILNSIQTVFLDGHPVDDIKTARLEPDSELALSAAMPGALGAVMRRGGYYASMRKHITFQAHECKVPNGAFFIKVKLFNLLLSQLGPSLLKHGIVLDSQELADYSKGFEQEILSGEWMGQAITRDNFAPILRSLPDKVRVRFLLKA